MADIKPRTIPEALGLSERKCVAIAESVKESLGERSTMDALLEIKSMFTDDSERIFAIYAYSVALGIKKAEKKFNEALPQIAERSMQAGSIMTLNALKEMEQKGMIKIIDLDPENLKTKPDSGSSLPDDLLYGADFNPSNTDAPSIFKSDEPVVKAKPGEKKDEDRMYG
jgi:hypothetical protein